MPVLVLNTGNGFAPGITSQLDPRFRPNSPIMFNGTNYVKFDAGFRVMDYNQDGNQDLLLLGTDNMSVRSSAVVLQSDGQGHFQGVDLFAVPIGIRPVPNGSETDRGYPTSKVLDIDGDGVSDIVTELSDGSIHISQRKRKRADRMVSVVDGLGVHLTVDYEAISSHPPRATGDELYTPGTSCAKPQYCMRRGMDVVASYHTDNGVNQDVYQFSYVDGTTTLTGRAWLGFQKRIRKDLNTGAVLTTEYDNHTTVGSGLNEAYPYGGMPKKESETIPVDNGRTLTKTKDYTNVIISQNVAGDPSVFGPPSAARATTIVESTYDQGSAGSGDPGGLATQVTTTRNFDNFGNPTLLQTRDLQGNQYQWQVPTGGYINDTTKWLIGLLTNVTETSTTFSGESKQR